jgi:hypothetical protein
MLRLFVVCLGYLERLLCGISRCCNAARGFDTGVKINVARNEDETTNHICISHYLR